MKTSNELTSQLTFLDVLEKAVVHTPEKTAFTYLRNGLPHESITYHDLIAEAKELASYLQMQGLQGKRALIMFPSSLTYIKTFLACLYAGVVAVPVYPPTLSKNLSRISSVIQHSSADCILTNRKLQTHVSTHLQVSRSINWICLDEIQTASIESYTPPYINGETLAFLQYTSGSTSAPKGVMISHKNILANEEMIKQSFGNNKDSKILGWLPLYHDMGLIGNVLQPLYLGATCILMDPLEFLQRPIRWLKAISDYKTEISGGPNFAYELCIKKIKDEDIEKLDLSSWKVAFNGAEPIRSDTLRNFSEKFGPTGFKIDHFYPCYGMAEATLLIAGGNSQDAPIIKTFDSEALKLEKAIGRKFLTSESTELVSSGVSSLNQTIKIVDPNSNKVVPDNTIGEIWVSGANVAQGYLRNDSPDTFNGEVCDLPDKFLKTGDLGFIDEGQLFVTGRLKDVIVLRGKNFYPQDIEMTVEKTSKSISTSACAAFSIVHQNEEKLVIIAELERAFRPRQGVIKEGFEPNELLKLIRKEIMQEFSIQAFQICLIKSGSILKTSSGKIRRSACKEAYESRELEIWFSDAKY